MKKRKITNANAGFSFIELLTVIAIIGILAVVIVPSLMKSRKKGGDMERIQALQQIADALELYYADHRQYPAANEAWGVNNAHGNQNNDNAEKFLDELEPYIKGVDAKKFLLGGSTQWGSFFYRSSSATNYQTYGAMIEVENKENKLAIEDGGYYPSGDRGGDLTGGHNDVFYEVGQDPSYCWSKYQSSWLGKSGSRCYSGN